MGPSPCRRRRRSFGSSALEIAGDPGVFQELRGKFPDAAIIGCSTGGEIRGDEVLDASGVAAVIRFDATSPAHVHFARAEPPALVIAAGLIANAIGEIVAVTAVIVLVLRQRGVTAFDFGWAKKTGLRRFAWDCWPIWRSTCRCTSSSLSVRRSCLLGWRRIQWRSSFWPWFSAHSITQRTASCRRS